MSLTETQKKYEDLITNCDQLIKAGKISAVSDLISQLNFAQVPNPFRQGLAKICRRSGLVSQGLRLLQPLMKDSRSKVHPASPGEVCEYAVLLSRNGSIQEALTLLQELKAEAPPEALLYSGYCHVSTWEYAEAALCFEKFLASSSDNYSKLIARVNLASCYIVTTQLTRAAEILTETIEMAKAAGANRLAGNCYELWGQVYFWQGNFSESRKALRRSQEILGESQSHDQLLISKSESIMAALEQKSMEPLLKFRKEASARKHWESVREADLFSLKVQFDQNLLDHLIFGTPLPRYRQRIRQLIGAEPNSTYILGSKKGLILNLSSGETGGSLHLRAGKKIHQTLAALARDFYVPINLGTLFSELYPGEFYDVDSSPFRVRQLMMRTRQWLKENKLPVLIEQTEGAYFFTIRGKFGLQMSLEAPVIDVLSLRWHELRMVFENQSGFTRSQVCRKMNWSLSMFHRVIDWALENAKIHRSGHGKSTVYKFLPNQDETIKKSA